MNSNDLMPLLAALLLGASLFLAFAWGASRLPRVRRVSAKGIKSWLAVKVEPRIPVLYSAHLAKLLRKCAAPPEERPARIVAEQLFNAVLIVPPLFLALRSLALPVALLLLAAPYLELRKRVRNRERALTRALPFALDLLTLGVEAGLDFAAAMKRAVDSCGQSALTEELSLLLRELQMGRRRDEALRALGERVGLPSVTSLTAALIQADRVGTPLGRTLRFQSAQLRQERSMRAEKLAGEAPVKLLFPLVACFFPTLFLILFGPILFSFVFGGAR